MERATRAEALAFLRRAFELDTEFALRAHSSALLSRACGRHRPCRVRQRRAVRGGVQRRPKRRSRTIRQFRGFGLCGLRAGSDLGQIERGAEILRQASRWTRAMRKPRWAWRSARVVGRFSIRESRACDTDQAQPPRSAAGFWGWASGLFLLRANLAEEALEEARISARRDPRLHLPLVLEAVTQATLGRTVLARAALMSARRIRPKLTLREIEISHGRRASKILASVWDEN